MTENYAKKPITRPGAQADTLLQQHDTCHGSLNL